MAAQAWLYRDGQRLCPLVIADSFLTRLRGLLGRDGIDGALLLEPANSIHTIGMRFDLDVAFLDAERRVLRHRTVRRNRLSMPVLHARSVLEAEAGAFTRWGLDVGDRLDVV
jgi:uncharacterized membrane protein (UPF0127 family)